MKTRDCKPGDIVRGRVGRWDITCVLRTIGRPCHGIQIETGEDVYLDYDCEVTPLDATFTPRPEPKPEPEPLLLSTLLWGARFRVVGSPGSDPLMVVEPATWGQGVAHVRDSGGNDFHMRGDVEVCPCD